jgi:hypothetical protein
LVVAGPAGTMSQQEKIAAGGKEGRRTAQYRVWCALVAASCCGGQGAAAIATHAAMHRSPAGVHVKHLVASCHPTNTTLLHLMLLAATTMKSDDAVKLLL